MIGLQAFAVWGPQGASLILYAALTFRLPQSALCDDLDRSANHLDLLDTLTYLTPSF